MEDVPERISGLGILALAALVAAGCGGEGGEAEADEAAGQGQPEAALAPVAESGIQGTARMTRGGGAWTLKLELLGVEEGETYPAKLVRGGCGEGGETVSELETPHVGTVGVGSSLTRIDTSRIEEGVAYAVVVEGTDGSRAACGVLDGGEG